ncbi:MAG: outer membrane lipoprotein carrier protein LolA [Acidobacteriota bacterium]|nr:outer membrane lipoprotein carrier protein LolA [Acidobacteriota bacterium]
MHSRRKFVFIAAIAILLLPVRAAFAADDLQKVLHRLDVAAANFQTTSAEFEFDSIQTDPIPDKDVQKGTVYYDRRGKDYRMGIHINEVNGKPVAKDVIVAKGVVRLYEHAINQVTTLTKLSQYQSWFMLGFGASGKELAEKWEIQYLGVEMLNGVKTDKLELTPRDPAIRKNLPKVTIWIDPELGVSLKQVFDEGQGQSRICTYFNIRVNQTLPSNAFILKTDHETHYVNR